MVGGSKGWACATALVAATLGGLCIPSAIAQGLDARPAATLAAAEAAFSPDHEPDPSREATVELAALTDALPMLEGAERRRARALLARPTDGRNDRYGDGYPPGAPVASAQSEHFCVFWVDDPDFLDAPELTDERPANGIPDYVDALLEIAETSYGVEVAPGPLGWPPPRPDHKGCGEDPGTRADVYLKELGRFGLFGYESSDPGQGKARSKYGYMVLDDDYSRREFGYEDPLVPAKVTSAHEFNHLLQESYDSQQDVWMFESVATWVEDKVFPEVNDYVGYIESFAASPGSPLTNFKAANGLKVYGSAVWNHWLDAGVRGYGADVIRNAWEISDETDPRDFAIAAYAGAIQNAGGRSFSHEFAAFAGASAEWRTGDFGFPDAATYPDVRRAGVLRIGTEARRFSLDHTGYHLFDVRPRRGRVRLRVRAERGVRTGIALVGRDGTPVGGAATVRRRFLPRGGGRGVVLRSAGRFERVTAVIVNADGRASGFGRRDWDYTRDDRAFRARITR